MSLRRRAVSALTFDEEAIGNAVSNLIRVRDEITLVYRQRAVELVNTRDAAVFDERLEHMLEPRRPVAMMKYSGQRGRAQIQIDIHVIAQQVLPYDLSLNRIEAITVKSRAHGDARRQCESGERFQWEGQARGK